jgi:hypothetical protein
MLQMLRRSSAIVSGMSTGPRSVKIGDNERGGWSSERPRRPGEPERPPRPVDVGVRGRVLSPSDSLRYSPGSLLLIACADPGTRDAFAARVIADAGALLSLRKVRGLLEGRVGADVIDEKTQALLDAAAKKRLAEDPAERERYVRMAHAYNRPRHLILVEAGKDKVADEDRTTLGELRTALDAGELGREGFVTSLRLGGATVSELKRIVFAPPPRDD